MSQFHAYLGDSTASETDISVEFEESLRSPITRNRKISPNNRSTIHRSRSTTATPPQSESFYTQRRGRSAGSSQERRIELSPSNNSPQRRRDLPSTSKGNQTKSPTRNKRKQSKPKKKQDKPMKEICILQQSTSKYLFSKE